MAQVTAPILDSTEVRVLPCPAYVIEDLVWGHPKRLIPWSERAGASN
jgi:hypothetical protein